MNLRPDSSLFDLGKHALLQYAQRQEQLRSIFSYLIATLLALPVAVLPWLLYQMSQTGNSAQPLLQRTLMPVSGIEAAPFFLLFVIVTLGISVFLNVVADRQYERALHELSKQIRTSDLALSAVSPEYAAAVKERVSDHMSLISLSPVLTAELRSRVDYFAHYSRMYMSCEQTGRSVIRQNPAMNLLITLAVVLLCLLIIGYLLIPVAIRHMFLEWPRVNAARLSIAEFLMNTQSS